MILESAQMLCTAHHVCGDPEGVPYKAAHINHPSTIWARENASNYEWLFHHFCALSREYKKRYGKTHLSYTKCFHPLSFIIFVINLTNFSMAIANRFISLYNSCSFLFIITYTFKQRMTIAISFSTFEVRKCSCLTYIALHFFEVIL